MSVYGPRGEGLAENSRGKDHHQELTLKIKIEEGGE